MSWDNKTFKEWAFLLFICGKDEQSLLRYVLYAIGIITFPVTLVLGILSSIKFEE